MVIFSAPSVVIRVFSARWCEVMAHEASMVWCGGRMMNFRERGMGAFLYCDGSVDDRSSEQVMIYFNNRFQIWECIFFPIGM